MKDVYVINLDKSKSRYNNISSRLRELNLPFKRFSAVYGKDLSENEIIKATTNSCRTKLCNKSMIGCGLSHYTLWTNIAKDTNRDDNEFTLIVEDDCRFPDDFKQQIKEIYEELSKSNVWDQTDMIYLYCLGDCKPGLPTDFFSLYGKCSSFWYGKKNPIKLPDHYKLSVANFPNVLTGYLINRRGARKLVEQLNHEKLNYHVDYQIATNKTVNCLCAPILEPDFTMDSTIGVHAYPFIIPNLVKSIGLNKLAWFFNIPVLTIGTKHEVSLIMLLYLVTLLFLATIRRKYFWIAFGIIFAELLIYLTIKSI